MKSRITGLRVASAVFGLAFLGQLARLVTRTNVTVGDHNLPLWASGIALVIVGGLSFWLWRLSLEAPPSSES